MALASYAERRKRLGDGDGRWATGNCSWRRFRNAVRDNLDVHHRRSTRRLISPSNLRSEHDGLRDGCHSDEDFRHLLWHDHLHGRVQPGTVKQRAVHVDETARYPDYERLVRGRRPPSGIFGTRRVGHHGASGGRQERRTRWSGSRRNLELCPWRCQSELPLFHDRRSDNLRSLKEPKRSQRPRRFETSIAARGTGHQQHLSHADAMLGPARRRTGRTHCCPPRDPGPTTVPDAGLS